MYVRFSQPLHVHVFRLPALEKVLLRYAPAEFWSSFDRKRALYMGTGDDSAACSPTETPSLAEQWRVQSPDAIADYRRDGVL